MGGVNVGGPRHGLNSGLGQRHGIETGLVPGDDVDLGVAIGKGQLKLDQEAVELCLGQGVGALILDGVLRGDDHERIGQLACQAIDGYRVLLHGLKQGGLGFGGRAVDFVGEQEVGEHGALAEDELRASRVPHHGAGDVGGHEVRSELDARHVDVEGASQGAHQQGLGDAGNTLEEGVPLGDERDDQS